MGLRVRVRVMGLRVRVRVIMWEGPHDNPNSSPNPTLKPIVPPKLINLTLTLTNYQISAYYKV